MKVILIWIFSSQNLTVPFCVHNSTNFHNISNTAGLNAASIHDRAPTDLYRCFWTHGRNHMWLSPHARAAQFCSRRVDEEAVHLCQLGCRGLSFSSSLYSDVEKKQTAFKLSVFREILTSFKRQKVLTWWYKRIHPNQLCPKSLQHMQKDILRHSFVIFFNSNVNILCTFYYRMTVKKKRLYISLSRFYLRDILATKQLGGKITVTLMWNENNDCSCSPRSDRSSKCVFGE